MKTKIFAAIMLIFSVIGTGCKKFLMVDPKSTVSEDKLLQSEVGFQQALIGIYAKAASRSLYGDNLSMGFLSIIGQNYNTSANLFPYPQTAALNYKTGDAITFVSAIWLNAYNAISGINNILDKIDDKQSLFTDNNFNLVKGEALGLRAYLHFDLLRLYGPIYANNPTKKAIPYRTQLKASPTIASTADEVSLAVLNDLKLAADLLRTTDPIMSADKNRRFRMNYMAVKALEARVYLYRNDKVNATLAAQEVVNSGKFSFVKSGAISGNAKVRDRLFSTEQVFALRVKTMKDWVETTNAYFKQASDTRYYLTRTEANFNTLYESTTGGSTDYRFTYLIETDGVKFCTKYWQTWELPNGGLEANRLDQTVPLIRMSEMYYILAEAAATPEAGVVYLNEVRKNRGLSQLSTTGLTAQTLAAEITKEYQKEFFAEGQTFFYYKRKAFSSILFSSRVFTEGDYTIPIPDDETEFNPNF